jgi:hypothetical protein
MNPTETVVYLFCGFGTLLMAVGAFGLLDAVSGNSRGSRWAVPLILTYAAGVLLNVTGLGVYGKWYFAVPMALMVVPVEWALYKHGGVRRPNPVERG